MTLVSRANALASRLAGPAPTSCCPGCFTSLADRLQAATARELDAVRAGCHPFWDACVAIVIQERTEDEVDALECALDENLERCRREHDNAADDESAFVETACRCLQLALGGQGDCASERAEGSRKPFYTSRGFWPSSSEQLFPDGPLATITSLVRWGTIITSFQPIIVLVCLVRIALPFVLDSVDQSSELRASIVKLIIDRLRGRDAAERGVTPEGRGPTWFARLNGIAGASCLLNTFLWGPDCGGGDLLSVLRGREADVFPEILGGLAFLDGSNTGNMDEPYKGLANTANLLQQRLGRPIDVLPVRALEYRNLPKDLPDVMSRFVAILDLKCRRRCAGPGCGLFAHVVAPDAEFQQCPGCEKLCYCSDECQQRDWTEAADGRIPHKNVCAAIRKISDGEACASVSSAEWTDVLDFMMEHNALPWAYRERARELRRPRLMMTFFAVGPIGTMHWNAFADV